MTAKEAIKAALVKAFDGTENGGGIIKPKQADAPKGGSEANAQEESLQDHIKHWHKNVTPAQPCEWMIKHGYGGVAANANPQNGGSASGAPGAGAAAQANAKAQAAANVEQPKPTALSNDMGTVKSLSPQFSAWCEKMGQRYEAETDPVKKQRIANIYFGLQKKYGGEVKKTPDQIKTEIDKTKQDFAANKERVAALRKEKEQDVWQQYKNAFEALKGQLKRGEITEKQFDRKQTKLEKTLDKGLADLKVISDEDLLKQADAANAKNKADADKIGKRKPYAPKQRENASEGAKKVQKVLGGIGAKRDQANGGGATGATGATGEPSPQGATGATVAANVPSTALKDKFGEPIDMDDDDKAFMSEMESDYANEQDPDMKLRMEARYKQFADIGKMELKGTLAETIGNFATEDKRIKEAIADMEKSYSEAQTPATKRKIADEYKKFYERFNGGAAEMKTSGKYTESVKKARLHVGYQPKPPKNGGVLSQIRGKLQGVLSKIGGEMKEARGDKKLSQGVYVPLENGKYRFVTNEDWAYSRAKTNRPKPQPQPQPQQTGGGEQKPQPQPKFDALQRSFGELETENLQPEAKAWLSDIEGRFAKANPTEQLKILGEYRKGMKLWGFKTKPKKTDGEAKKELPPTQTAQATIPNPGGFGYAGTAQTQTQQDLLNKILSKNDE